MELGGEGGGGAGVEVVELHFDTVAGGEQSGRNGAASERSGDDGAGAVSGAAADHLRRRERSQNIVGIRVAIAGRQFVAGLAEWNPPEK